MLKHLFWGIIARLLNIFISTKKRYWAFGSDEGRSYKEGSKYLIEYILSTHPDYHCVYVTANRDVLRRLNERKIPCVMNYSVKGIIEIAKCEAIFTTQSINDIRYAYKKKGRKYFYLVHGMPFKRAFNQLPKNYVEQKTEGKSVFVKIKDIISRYFTLGYWWNDIDFVSACSPFLAGFMRKEFDPSVEVKVLGMPRNDALFQPKRMAKEKWIDGIDDKFVILYMPTHRGYGTGTVTPTPFIKRPDVQQWFRDNNVVFLMKNHPNMIPKLKDKKDTDVIKDITKLGLDPQVCIYHSDVLITDYSSVWMDYLLLRRPILFYIYDNFEKNDVGTYYDLSKTNVGHFCYNEDEMFNLIKICKMDSKAMIASDEVVHKYHTYIDGKSCERYFNTVSESVKRL